MNTSEEKVSPGLEEFVREFYLDRLNEFEDLKSQVDKNDTESVYKILHKWKGYSAPYGFLILEKLSVKLESALRESNNKNVERCLEDIEIYLSHKGEELELIH